PRRATTRGSRGCSGKTDEGRGKRDEGRALGLAGALLLVQALLFSQQTTPTQSHPEVVNLTLKGVKSVKQSDLLTSIYTTASYCNSFLLKPFCWISKSKYFYTRKYLDHQELHRDVLRARVFYWKRGFRETEVDTAVVSRGHNQVGVTFLIKEGPPTLISDIAVNQPTPTLLSQREIGKRVVLSKNAPLNMIRVDSSRFFLQTSLFDKGYADAEVDTTIVLDSASHTATVTFTLNPKYKTTVQESPSREARVSAGFNTIDFGQFESRFTDYNFFGSARRLDVQGVVGNLFAKSLSGRGIFQNATLAQTSSLARYFVPTYNASI